MQKHNFITQSNYIQKNSEIRLIIDAPTQISSDHMMTTGKKIEMLRFSN